MSKDCYCEKRDCKVVMGLNDGRLEMVLKWVGCL